jgi:hypothetical protein
MSIRGPTLAIVGSRKHQKGVYDLRRLMVFVTCAVLFVVLGLTVAQADVIHEGWNGLFVDGVKYVEVKELVYNPTQTEENLRSHGVWDDAYEGWYLYSYTVGNDKFADAVGGVWCWGISMTGSPTTPIIQVLSPAGWGYINCPWVAGTQTGWVGAPPIAKATSLDTFWLVSPGKPYNMYPAYAHGPGGAGGIAYGEVSGPIVPEPMSMTLLGVALAGGIVGLRKRRR